MNKKGEMTITKLVSIILGIMILVLIIMGVITGGLKPLGQKIETQFNKVLIFFAKDNPITDSCQVYSKDCHIGCTKESIDDVGTGDFSFCSDACYLVLDEKETIIAEQFNIYHEKYYKYGTNIQYDDQKLLTMKNGKLIKVEQKSYSYDYKNLKLSESFINPFTNEIKYIDITEYTTERGQALIRIYENLYVSMIGENNPNEKFTIIESPNDENYPKYIEYENKKYSININDGDPSLSTGFYGILKYKGFSNWKDVSPEINMRDVEYKNITKILTFFQENCR